MRKSVAELEERVEKALVGRFYGRTFDCVVAELFLAEDKLKAKNRKIKTLKTALTVALEAMRKNITFAALKDESVLADAMIHVQKALKGRRCP